MTGNRQAYPLLISLANINMEFRMKASNHAFLLLMLLPIPTFIANQNIKGALEDHLIHECLDLILELLKTAARIGIMLTDPAGNRCYCFTPLASYIVNTPESALLAGMGGKTSSITTASYKEFGDPFHHEPCTASITLGQLDTLAAKINPWNFKDYLMEAKQLRLNGVHKLFWRDWALSNPSQFLTPEPLHHWHKQFWDHDIKWCIHVVGAAEIDFCFTILHPHTGFQHFSEGISSLKQVTGREHRDIERYIIPLIARAVPKDFLIAVRSLMDFCYLVQAQAIDDNTCGRIQAALSRFHAHKESIIWSGGRCGKKGHVIDNWYISKLEFMQSVVPSIIANGAAIQWSANVTEHAHITIIKGPARMSNNHDYKYQICCHLD